MNKINQQIRLLAKNANLSLIELAQKAGLSSRTFYHADNPTIDTICRLAKVLKMQPAEVLNFLLQTKPYEGLDEKETADVYYQTMKYRRFLISQKKK